MLYSNAKRLMHKFIKNYEMSQSKLREQTENFLIYYLGDLYHSIQSIKLSFENFSSLQKIKKKIPYFLNHANKKS